MDYHNVYGNVANTIDVNKDHHYWRIMFARWIKDMVVKGKLLHQCGARVPPYGTKIDLQLVDTVKSYNYHARCANDEYDFANSTFCSACDAKEVGHFRCNC